MKKYQSQKIRSYVQKILEGNDIFPGKARVVADVLIEADLRGIYSHGINNLDILIIDSIKAGGTDPKAVQIDITKNNNNEELIINDLVNSLLNIKH